MLSMGPNLQAEMRRTAEMIVDIADTRGVYFAVALLYDSGYSNEDIKILLPFLLETKGSVKSTEV